MTFLDLARARRSQRADLLPTPIRDEDVDYLAEAARWAPSPFNIQPWAMLFVTEAGVKAELGALSRTCTVQQLKDAGFVEDVARWTSVTQDEWRARGDGVFLGDQLDESSLAGVVAPFLMKHPSAAALLGKLGAGHGPGKATQRLLADAPLVCVVFRDDRRVSPGANGAMWTSFAVGAMFQNLLLAATERGIGAQFVCTALETPDGRRRVAELLRAPAGLEPVLILRLGYLSPDGAKTSVRRPREAFVGRERFEEDT
jgi:nitroreductase